MAIVSQCTEATFSLMREDGVEIIKGVDVFNYLGRPLDQLDNKWPVVISNIRKVRQGWGLLGKLLWREGGGGGPFVSSNFYREVVQAVLLFGEGIWVPLAASLGEIKAVHVFFLCQVTGKKARRQNDGSWRMAASESVLQEVGMQPLQTYIGQRQAKVAEWVELRPILGYAQRKCATGGGLGTVVAASRI